MEKLLDFLYELAITPFHIWGIGWWWGLIALAIAAGVFYGAIKLDGSGDIKTKYFAVGAIAASFLLGLIDAFCGLKNERGDVGWFGEILFVIFLIALAILVVVFVFFCLRMMFRGGLIPSILYIAAVVLAHSAFLLLAEPIHWLVTSIVQVILTILGGIFVLWLLIKIIDILI